MADQTIAVRRPASARPRPPAAKEEAPKVAPEEREDDGLGIADDSETWFVSIVSIIKAALREALSCKCCPGRLLIDHVALHYRLFSVRDAMTTEEISRMGFTNVILLNADRWRSAEGDEAVGICSVSLS